MGFLSTTVCFFDVGVGRREQDVNQHKAAMKARWPDDCDAWWPCTRMSAQSELVWAAQLQLFLHVRFQNERSVLLHSDTDQLKYQRRGQ